MSNPSSAVPVISKPLMERIIRAACAYWEITEEQLLEKSTETFIAYRRKICFYLIKTHVMLSYARIAVRFGLKDPWNISCAVDEIDSTKNIYPQTTRDIEAVLQIANNLADSNNLFYNGVDRK